MLFYLTIPLLLAVTIFYSVAGTIAAIVDSSGRLYHAMFRQWSKALLWLLRVRVSVHGAEHLDDSHNYVYLANHSSYLDIPVLGAHIPDRLRLIFKEELTKVPIWGWALLASPHIKIRRSDARDAMGSIERAAEEIRQGASVVIFPEGTRSRDGRLGEFKRGGFLLATRSGVRIVPVGIRGTFPLLPRHDWRVRPGHVDLFIGSPIANPGGLERTEERALQANVRAQIEALLSRPQ